METAFFDGAGGSLRRFGKFGADAAHHRCGGNRRAERGNTVHESSIFSLVPYLPAIIGLLVIGRLMEKWWGTDEPVAQGHP